MNSSVSDTAKLHSGISMHRIAPVEGAVGGLFVLSTVLTFAGGIPAIREILFVTLPLGILASAILLTWHKRHPVRLDILDLHQGRR